MERRKNRMSVGGLRLAEPTTLSVLTQDVLRLPVTQIEPSTLLDLLALAEVPDQLTSALSKELARFREQIYREIEDLPDGEPLAELANELSEISAEQAPQSLRDHLGGLVDEREHPEAVEALERLMAHWEGTEPKAIKLPEPSKAPRVESGSKAKVEKVAAKPKRAKRATTPAPLKDPRREEWVREDAMARLKNYGARGLKEAIVVAGCRHRSPWKDMDKGEVLATLRKLKREGRLRFSAGRWMINN